MKKYFLFLKIIILLMLTTEENNFYVIGNLYQFIEDNKTFFKIVDLKSYYRNENHKCNPIEDEANKPPYKSKLYQENIDNIINIYSYYIELNYIKYLFYLIQVENVNIL